MPVVVEITESVIRQNIERAITEVFRTMIRAESSLMTAGETFAAPDYAPLEPHRPQVVGTVGFIGSANGLIYLYFDLAFARFCTCQLTGMTEGELEENGDEVINDAIGELTNMTVGTFKNALCDAGYPCKLTIPSIVRGTNFSIEPIGAATRHIFNFNCAGHLIVADILLERDE
jgi:chemotaxis protein CheX